MMEADSSFPVQITQQNKSSICGHPLVSVMSDSNLPWVEKYRPNVLDQVVAHSEIIATRKKEKFLLIALIFFS